MAAETDFAPMVQILDEPEPQVVDQLVEALMLFDISVPEQVIGVPKIAHPVLFARLLPPRRWRGSW